MNIPDYISPIVAYRAWRWNATGLKSLNGEPWHPGRPLAAGCRAAGGTIIGRAEAVHGAQELPHPDCTCGVDAAKNLEHLRQIGYEWRGIHGAVSLWGKLVEHKLGWRAQFAYPKSLFLPRDAIPFSLSEMNSRLKALIAFGADIFIVGDHESICFWKNGAGIDAAGLDYLIKTRKEYYIRRQRERTLKKGDRVAVLGRGLAVIEQIDSKDAVVIFGSRKALRIPRQEIVLNQHNRRWEYAGQE